MSFEEDDISFMKGQDEKSISSDSDISVEDFKDEPQSKARKTALSAPLISSGDNNVDSEDKPDTNKGLSGTNGLTGKLSGKPKAPSAAGAVNIAELRQKLGNARVQKHPARSKRELRKNLLEGSAAKNVFPIQSNNTSDDFTGKPTANVKNSSGSSSPKLEFLEDSIESLSSKNATYMVSQNENLKQAGRSRSRSNAASHDREYYSLEYSAVNSDATDAMKAASEVIQYRYGVPPPTTQNNRVNVGDNVLVNLAFLDNIAFQDGTSHISRSKATSAPVNKLGYPRGGGTTAEEKLGPWEYVLAKVIKVHFDEADRYYSVLRYDTNTMQRADRAWISSIEPNSDGEKAAMDAAKRNTVELIPEEQDRRPNWFKNSCASFTAKRLVDCVHSIGRFLKKQASMITSGKPPYSIQINFTTVNFLVLCSILLAFLEPIKLSFIPFKADRSIRVIIFVAWIVLLLELIFEVSIRPKNFRQLLEKEEAYSPKTVRHINRFHLAFEFIALLSVIPDFLPLFVHERITTLSFTQAAIAASQGASTGEFILGHLYFLLLHLRLFGLIRHKRNHWIQPHVDEILDDSKESSEKDKKNGNIHTKDNDSTLRRADTISTALLLVNSQRAMMLLLLITGIVPLLSSASNGGRNKAIYKMTDYLHNLNKNTPVNPNTTECIIYESGVDAWFKSQKIYSQIPSENTLDTSHSDSRVVWVSMSPMRCKYNNTLVYSPPTECVPPDLCENLSDLDLFGLEKLLQVRVGSVTEVSRGEEETVQTVVRYNLSDSVKRTAFNFFLLQTSLLILLIVSLGFLRRDANRYVIAPLRKMLKIILRYAENPLVGAPSETKPNSESELNIDDLFASDENDIADATSGKSKLGSYETEQLITAVTKITDLLRKCWGVAGAGIISSNLARNVDGKNTVVFNPTVPGKKVYAIFGFAGINDFSHLLRNLDRDVMELINDVAKVVHNEVYRWGLGSSGQCNKNLGANFLMVYRIGDVDEVKEKQARATNVFFENEGPSTALKTSQKNDDEVDFNLASIPGIAPFADRALLGLLKSFAGIHREEKIRKWESDPRLSAFVSAFSVEMSFGMDAGWAVEGAVGSSYKIDATYLSPNVNMASRMMCACKQYKLTILMSYAVYEMLSPQAKGVTRHVDTVYVKGSTKKQPIYTFDARHKGVDFFLNKRSDAQADKEADSYSPTIWEKDQDLSEMQSHITKAFKKKFAHGLELYLKGNFKLALGVLKEANNILIKDVVEDGRIDDLNRIGNKLLDDESNDEEVINMRKEIGDGPCQTLIAYIEKEQCKPPKDWKGVRQLTDK